MSLVPQGRLRVAQHAVLGLTGRTDQSRQGTAQGLPKTPEYV